jgi:hypothetical protein
MTSMARKLSKEETERKTFEFLAPLTPMRIVPGSILQNPPPAPDIECEIEGVGRMAFELVALDADDTRTRLSNMNATREAWGRALKSWPGKEQEALRADCDNVFLALNIEETAGGRARAKIMKEIQTRLLAKGSGFEGDLFRGDETFDGLNRARVHRGKLSNGPRINAPSAGAWLAPQVDKIREKLSDKNYQTERPLELFAYATHDEVDAHVNSLPMIDECVRRYLPGSRFRRIWVFNRHFGQLVYVHPPPQGAWRHQPDRLFGGSRTATRAAPLQIRLASMAMSEV